MRQFDLLDSFIENVDLSLRTIFPPPSRVTKRLTPGKELAESPLTEAEKRHVAGLMRVNHSGEVSAQALYQGQSLTAKLPYVKEQMRQAAEEETDHLAWCEQRLRELNSRPSLLNPLWYFGSLLIGAGAGFISDAFSLGFVAETETQVSLHLQEHLDSLPKEDLKTQAILQQMKLDENEHAKLARAAGAIELPFFIQKTMQLVAKIMTKTAYYI